MQRLYSWANLSLLAYALNYPPHIAVVEICCLWQWFGEDGAPAARSCSPMFTNEHAQMYTSHVTMCVRSRTSTERATLCDMHESAASP